MEFDIRNQPDSPLRLFIDRQLPRPGSPVTVRNEGVATVAAFVLRVDVEPYGMNKMVILGPRGLGVGQSVVEGLATRVLDEKAPKPVVSVDYVQFADGQTWGEDSLRKGKDASAYLQGRALAMSRLEKLLAGQDDSEVKKMFDVFGGSSIAEPNMPIPGRPSRDIDYSVRGYEEVIRLLRGTPRNSDQAKDLARKLELMGPSPDH